MSDNQMVTQHQLPPIKVPPLDLTNGGLMVDEWCLKIYNWAAEKGWNTERSFPETCALLHTEITEAFEEYRNHHRVDEVYFNPGYAKPEGIPIELADLAIRLFHFFGEYNISLQAVLEIKQAYNETRPYRHGGKQA